MGTERIQWCCWLRQVVLAVGVFMVFGFSIAANHSTAVAQEPLSEREWKLGYEGFNVICSGIGLEHAPNFGTWNSRRPTDTIVVILGSLAQPPVLPDRYLQRGGAMFVAVDKPNSRALAKSGIVLDQPNRRSGKVVFERRFSFDGHVECPVVDMFFSHPIREGVNTIIGNNVLSVKKSRTMPRIFADRPEDIAFLPLSQSQLNQLREPSAFISVVDNSAGGRLVCMGDQSVLSNQMLMHGDNAVFAQNVMLWLSEKPDGGKRKHLLVWDGKKFLQSVDIGDIDIDLPAPTSAEVVEALKNLPAASLIDFGNSVIAAVEDEDMINEFIRGTMDKQSPKIIDRFWIFLSFALIGFFSLATYVWQKKLLRTTASDVAARRSSKSGKQRKNDAAFERQMAVEVLLDSFCVEVANRRYYDCPAFPDELTPAGVYGKQRDINALFKSMKKVNQQYQSKASKYWTTQRLLDLEAEVGKWKTYFPESK